MPSACACLHMPDALPLCSSWCIICEQCGVLCCFQEYCWRSSVLLLLHVMLKECGQGKMWCLVCQELKLVAQKCHTSSAAALQNLCREQAEQDAKMEEAIAKAAEELIDKFEEQWKPAMENLEEAEAVFDDLDGRACPDTSHVSAIICFLAWLEHTLFQEISN